MRSLERKRNALDTIILKTHGTTEPNQAVPQRTRRERINPMASWVGRADVVGSVNMIRSVCVHSDGFRDWTTAL